MSPLPPRKNALVIADLAQRIADDAYAQGRLSMAMEIRRAMAAEPAAPVPRHGMNPIDAIAFRAMWHGRASLAEMQAEFGFPNERAVSNRAHAMGFGPRFRRHVDATAFTHLWETGVAADAMAEALGMANAQSVNSRAHALGLPPRAKNK
ncbi:hypothetical protein EOD42_22235 [Rhodovarius crocodyli]|uniref:Uncharacterized protein n=1 Tax=Rhodovarius crocodyli TaxID=1979269 RepID=A0A437M1A5_9PROT|nr:hypothetical protein [Rhodovarius crocodyli]RVT91376.1 hypothetical protein EOD42_22235 [Rhodovarius crocodyli]